MKTRLVIVALLVALSIAIAGCGVGVIHGRELFTPAGNVGRLYHAPLPVNQWEYGAAPTHVTFQRDGMIFALTVKERASNAIVVGWLIPMIPIALGGPPPIDSSVLTITVSHTPLGPDDDVDYGEFRISSAEFPEMGPMVVPQVSRDLAGRAGSMVYVTLEYETGVADLESFHLRLAGFTSDGRARDPIELTFARDRSPVWAIYSMNA